MKNQHPAEEAGCFCYTDGMNRFYLFVITVVVVSMPATLLAQDGRTDGGTAVLSPSEGAVFAPREVEVKPQEPRAMPAIPATEQMEASRPQLEPIPVVEPVKTSPLPTTENPESNKNPTPFIMAIIIVGVAAFYSAYKLTQKTKGDNRSHTRTSCDDLRQQLERKQAELATVEGDISLKDALVEALEKELYERIEKEKNKIKEAVKGEARDVVVELDASGSAKEAVGVVEEIKNTYDDIRGKIDEVKKTLELFTRHREAASQEMRALDASYRTCVAAEGGVAKAFTLAEQAIELPSIDTKKNVVIAHGCSSKPEQTVNLETRGYDKHWVPWFANELKKRGIAVATPPTSGTVATQLRKI